MDDRTTVLREIGMIVARYLNQHEILGSVCDFDRAIQIYTDTEEYEIFESALQNIEYGGFRIEFRPPNFVFNWKFVKIYMSCFITNDDGDSEYFEVVLPSTHQDGTLDERWQPVGAIKAPSPRPWQFQRLREAVVYMKLREER